MPESQCESSQQHTSPARITETPEILLVAVYILTAGLARWAYEFGLAMAIGGESGAGVAIKSSFIVGGVGLFAGCAAVRHVWGSGQRKTATFLAIVVGVAFLVDVHHLMLNL